MKTNKTQAIALVIGLVIIGNTLEAQGWGKQRGGNRGARQTHPMTAPSAALTMKESEDLVYMREEEKLARDVYLTLQDRWNIQAFGNIASSEQRHMESLKGLLDRYGLVDPVTKDEVGVFQNVELATLYKEIVAKGGTSALDACKMGALIEELDIRDLMDAMDRTTHEDVAVVYENLMRGSRNHLRAFHNLILRAGDVYEPQFIGQEVYDAIVFTPAERGGQGKTGTDAACAGECERGVQQGRGQGGRNQIGGCNGGCESSQAIPQRGGKGNGQGRGQNRRNGR
jgi:hypothetical protein